MGDVGGGAIDGVVGGRGQAVTGGSVKVDGVRGEVLLKREGKGKGCSDTELQAL